MPTDDDRRKAEINEATNVYPMIPISHPTIPYRPTYVPTGNKKKGAAASGQEANIYSRGTSLSLYIYIVRNCMNTKTCDFPPTQQNQ